MTATHRTDLHRRAGGPQLWHSALWLLALAALLALLAACLLGRWRFVKASAMRPALDF